MLSLNPNHIHALRQIPYRELHPVQFNPAIEHVIMPNSPIQTDDLQNTSSRLSIGLDKESLRGRVRISRELQFFSRWFHRFVSHLGQRIIHFVVIRNQIGRNIILRIIGIHTVGTSNSAHAFRIIRVALVHIIFLENEFHLQAILPYQSCQVIVVSWRNRSRTPSSPIVLPSTSLKQTRHDRTRLHCWCYCFPSHARSSPL